MVAMAWESEVGSSALLGMPLLPSSDGAATLKQYKHKIKPRSPESSTLLTLVLQNVQLTVAKADPG